MGLSPSSTHTIVDPPIPMELQKNTHVAAPKKTTDPGHSAWGSRPSYRLALLCQGLRYLKPLWERYIRPADTGVTTAPCSGSRSQHPWSLCTFLPTQTKRNSTIAVGLKSDASTKGTTPVAPPSLVQQWTGFSPRDLMPKDTVPHSGAPNGGTTPQGCRHHYNRQECR